MEVLSTETQLRWPKAIVPISVCIISPKTGSKEALAINEADLQLYDSLVNVGSVRKNFHPITFSKSFIVHFRLVS